MRYKDIFRMDLLKLIENDKNIKPFITVMIDKKNDIRVFNGLTMYKYLKTLVKDFYKLNESQNNVIDGIVNATISKIFKEEAISDFLVLKSEYGKISKHQDKIYKLYEVLMDEHKYEWIFDKSQNYPFGTKWLDTFEWQYGKNIENNAE